MTSSSPRPLAIVTGASAGIGAIYADQLARRGYDLVLVARRRDRLDDLATRLARETGVRAEPLALDLTRPQEVEPLARRLAEDPACALLVNNAGFGGYSPFAALAPETLDGLLEIHVAAATRLCRAALPGFLARRRGGIINVASLLALSGTLPTPPLPQRAVYAGAKAYLLAFTQVLAGEVQGTGVQVQVCLPGLTATEFHSVQGMSRLPIPAMAPEDVVTASLAALDRGEVVCIPGVEEATAFDRVSEAQRAVFQGARPALASRYRAQTG